MRKRREKGFSRLEKAFFDEDKGKILVLFENKIGKRPGQKEKISAFCTNNSEYNWHRIVNFLETGIANAVNMRYNYGTLGKWIVKVVPIYPKGA